MPNQTKAEATARPWRVGAGEWYQLVAIYDRNCVYTASTHIGYQQGTPECIPSRVEAIANAALIVKAVNEYEALCAVAEAAEIGAEWLCESPAGTDQWERGVEIKSALKALRELRNQK